jgi:tetratricopeptide (TPR) repeat protein
MGIGNFFQGVAQFGGASIPIKQEYDMNQQTIELRKQQVATGKMDLLQKQQTMDIRKQMYEESQLDISGDVQDAKAPEQHAAKLMKKAERYEAAGMTDEARSARDLAKSFIDQSKDNTKSNAEKVLLTKETTAKAAIAYNEGKTPEAAQAFEAAYAKSGGDVTKLPARGTPQYDAVVRNARRESMTAKDIVEEDRKIAEDATKRSEARDKHDADLQERRDRDRQTHLDREASREDRKDARKTMELIKGSQTQKVPVAIQAKNDKLTTAALESEASIDNLVKLTHGGAIHTTAGAFDNLTDHGVIGATAKGITQTLNSDQKAMYTSIMMPLMRTAATIQGGAYYKLNESQVQQEMRAMLAPAGVSHLTMLEKMAELKQSIERGLEAGLDSETLKPKQEEAVTTARENIMKAIPWTVGDVIDFKDTGGKAKNFGEWLKKEKGIDLTEVLNTATKRASSPPVSPSADAGQSLLARYGLTSKATK